jgi:hypothetical protein
MRSGQTRHEKLGGLGPENMDYRNPTKTIIQRSLSGIRNLYHRYAKHVCYYLV